MFPKRDKNDDSSKDFGQSAQKLVSNLTDNKKSISERFNQITSFVKEKDVAAKIGVKLAPEFQALTNAEICFICKILGTADWCYVERSKK